VSNYYLDKKVEFAEVRPLFRGLNTKFLAYSLIEKHDNDEEGMVPYFGGCGSQQIAQRTQFDATIELSLEKLSYVWRNQREGCFVTEYRVNEL
jgi:hypothetical protein